MSHPKTGNTPTPPGVSTTPKAAAPAPAETPAAAPAKEKGKPYSLVLDPATYKKARVICEIRGTSVSRVVQEYLTRFVADGLRDVADALGVDKR
jgi:hypothetical protein